MDVALGAAHPTISFISVLTSYDFPEWSSSVVTRSFFDEG